MQARLVNPAGVYVIDLGTDSPQDSLDHGDLTYRLLGYDDPAWGGSFAIYAHEVDNRTAIERACAER